MSVADEDRDLVRRTRRRVARLVGVAVSLLVIGVGGLGYVLLVHAQQDQVQRELRFTAEHGEAAGPPGCTWLIELTVADGTMVGGPAPVPTGFPLRAEFDLVQASGTAHEVTVEANGTVYVVRTQPRGGEIIQAVFDTRYQLADQRALLIALAVAEALGVACAVVTGVLVGRRSVVPLVDALARQRRFVTDASHELRAPITQVHTRAQLLARRKGLAPEHRTELERLTRTTRRLGEIVDDLLRSARLGSADTTVDLAVDLAEVVESAVAAEADLAAGRDLTFTVDRPGGAVLVTGIESALRRVVGELLTNAVRHTPAGGRIAVSLRRPDGGGPVELTVTDTGSGFAPGDAERIFERFHTGGPEGLGSAGRTDAGRPEAGRSGMGRADGELGEARRPEVGRSVVGGDGELGEAGEGAGVGGPAGGDGRFGIGLALVREVVTSHRGTIEAVGEPGVGARFVVRLPSAPIADLALAAGRGSARR